jgi:hypothetical protein
MNMTSAAGSRCGERRSSSGTTERWEGTETPILRLRIVVGIEEALALYLRIAHFRGRRPSPPEGERRKQSARSTGCLGEAADEVLGNRGGRRAGLFLFSRISEVRT